MTKLAAIVLTKNEEQHIGPCLESLTWVDLSGEAIRLGRLLVRLLPEPEAVGLLAIMLLHESRHAARTSPEGDLVLLEDQDRSLWNREQIMEGTTLVRGALMSGQAGPYTLQAVIAAVHSAAPSFDATDWGQILSAYDMLMQVSPSPVVELNRAVAVAMREGPAAGLAIVDAILARGDLVDIPHLGETRRVIPECDFETLQSVSLLFQVRNWKPRTVDEPRPPPPVSRIAT